MAYNVKPALYIRKQFVNTQHLGVAIDGFGLLMCGKEIHGIVCEEEESRRGRDLCRACLKAWEKATSQGEHSPGHPSMKLPAGREWYRDIPVRATAIAAIGGAR